MTNKTIVIKCGGSIFDSLAESKTLFDNIKKLQTIGYQVILVHGGGADISRLAIELGVESKFHDGLRITTPEILKIVKMTLLGSNNSTLVNKLNQQGIAALGLSGQDNNLIFGDYLDKDTYGATGVVTHINASFINLLLDNNLTLVVAPLAVTKNGEFLNINADLAASAIACAIDAEHFILLSDIDGYYANYPDKDSIINKLTTQQIADLFANKAVTSGMIPKLQACVEAVANQKTIAYIINGSKNYDLTQLITEQSFGTTIANSPSNGIF